MSKKKWWCDILGLHIKRISIDRDIVAPALNAVNYILLTAMHVLYLCMVAALVMGLIQYLNSIRKLDWST